MNKLKTTDYKASTNGAVERFQITHNFMIGKVVNAIQSNLNEFPFSIISASRNKCYESIGYSPKNLASVYSVYGITVGVEQHYDSGNAFFEQKLQTMREAYRITRESLENKLQRAEKV